MHDDTQTITRPTLLDTSGPNGRQRRQDTPIKYIAAPAPIGDTPREQQLQSTSSDHSPALCGGTSQEEGAAQYCHAEAEQL